MRSRIAWVSAALSARAASSASRAGRTASVPVVLPLMLRMIVPPAVLVVVASVLPHGRLVLDRVLRCRLVLVLVVGDGRRRHRLLDRGRPVARGLPRLARRLAALPDVGRRDRRLLL